MATKVGSGSGVKAVKAVKAATAAGSNGAATPTMSIRVKPVPAKVIKAVAALGEPYRLAVLGYVAAATGPVMLYDIVNHLGCDDPTAMEVVNHLKQRGWLAADRVPKGSGGGWSYRLSDAGRERLLVLGG